MDIKLRIDELGRRVRRLELLHEVREKRKTQIRDSLEKFVLEIKEIPQRVREKLDKKAE